MSEAVDRPREACGVFGMVARAGVSLDVARGTFFGLSCLQHRGQESAGIAVCSAGGRLTVHKGMGLVDQVFSEEVLEGLPGVMALGHDRYSTTGRSRLADAQPITVETADGPLAVAHNGTLTNAQALRHSLMARGAAFFTDTDTEVIARLLAQPEPAGGPDIWPQRLSSLMTTARGAFSLGVMAGGALFALRDPHGLRPLCWGAITEDGQVVGWAIASESSALRAAGVSTIHDIAPGEVWRIGREGPCRVFAMETPPTPAFCVFEYIYFSRPDTELEGQAVHLVRRRLGAELGRHAPVEADVVVGVPNSGKIAAAGFAEALGLPCVDGLIRNRHVGRTFLQPTDPRRRLSVRLKYSPVRDVLEGKRVVLVDDSIVRGTTIGPLVRLLRDEGATEIHVRIAAPPLRFPCFLGVDLADQSQLIAHGRSVDALARLIGADSLGFLGVAGVDKAVYGAHTTPRRHCVGCFTGEYPVAPPPSCAS